MKYVIIKNNIKTKKERKCDYLQTWRVAYFSDEGCYQFSEYDPENKFWICVPYIPKVIKYCNEESAGMLFKRLEEEGYEIVEGTNIFEGNKYIYFDVEGCDKPDMSDFDNPGVRMAYFEEKK